MFGYIRIVSMGWLVRWSPIIILFLAMVWRVDGITEQSFWNDEGNSLSLIQRDANTMLEAIRLDIHPPGYYLILKGWAGLVGQHEFGLRMLSALWGGLAVAGTYALGARLYARAAGSLAAAIVAVNAFAVYYSQEARMYAQLTALAVLGLWLLSVWVMMSPQKRGFYAIAGGLAGVNALGLYTHYTYPFTMLIQGLFFLWWWIQTRGQHARAPHTLRVYIVLNLVTLALFAPWLPTAIDQLTRWPADDLGTPLADKITQIVTIITYGNTATDLGLIEFAWVGILFLMGALPDWYPRPPSDRWRAMLPLAWVLLLVGMLILSGAYREANLKFLLPAQIGVALIVGRSTYLLWDAGSGSAATPLETIPRYVALISYGMFILTLWGWQGELDRIPRDNYRALANHITTQSGPDAAVILNAPGQIDVFSYYFDEKTAPIYPLPRGYGGDDAATRAETLTIIEQHDQIYVVFWGEGERDPNGIVKQTLDTHAYELRSRWYGDVRLVEYGVLAPPPGQPTITTQARFGDHITLTGYALSGELAPDSPASVLGVTLFWEAAAPLQTRYKVFVQILTPQGTLLTQHDSEPANGRAPTPNWPPQTPIIDNHGLALPPNLPDGEYTIIVGVYELGQPAARLPVNDQDFYELERQTIP